MKHCQLSKDHIATIERPRDCSESTGLKLEFHRYPVLLTQITIDLGQAAYRPFLISGWVALFYQKSDLADEGTLLATIDASPRNFR